VEVIEFKMIITKSSEVEVIEFKLIHTKSSDVELQILK